MKSVEKGEQQRQEQLIRVEKKLTENLGYLYELTHKLEEIKESFKPIIQWYDEESDCIILRELGIKHRCPFFGCNNCLIQKISDKMKNKSSK